MSEARAALRRALRPWTAPGRLGRWGVGAFGALALLGVCGPAAAQTYLTQTLAPSDDTDVKGNSGGGGTCGGCLELSIREHSTGDYRPGFRFAFNGLPSGTRLVSATLRLYATTAKSNLVSIYRSGVSWAEATASYDSTNGLSPTGAVQASFTPATAGRYYDINLTTLTGQWLAGTVPNFGVVLTSPGGSVGRFTSKEWGTVSQHPQLVLTLLPPPALTPVRSTAVLSDPLRGTTNPVRIPGAVVSGTLTLENQSSGYPDADSVVLAEAVPSGGTMYVGDLGAEGSGPVAFVQGTPSSGVSFTYGGLSSTTDDLDFSADGGVSWLYAPVPDATGYDAAVTHYRVRPKGTFAGEAGAGNPRFTITTRLKVK